MEKIASLKASLDKRIEELIDLISFPEENLAKGIRYTLLSGGKRLRPLLTLTLGEALGVEKEKLIDPAIALEMVHTYSLIHDDLPCMDNDDFRRNLPTLHRVVGEASALLTGDLLLTYAFEVLSCAPHLSPEIRL